MYTTVTKASGVLALLLYYIQPSMVYASGVERIAKCSIVKNIGKYKINVGHPDYSVELRRGMGGKLDFMVFRKGNTVPAVVIEDATAFSWLDSYSIIITASPIYGIPGVYLYIVPSNITIRIFNPLCYTNTYPNGADYFELTKVNGNIIVFSYAPYIELVKSHNTLISITIHFLTGKTIYDKNTMSYRNDITRLLDVGKEECRKINNAIAKYCSVMPIYDLDCK